MLLRPLKIFYESASCQIYKFQTLNERKNLRNNIKHILHFKGRQWLAIRNSTPITALSAAPVFIFIHGPHEEKSPNHVYRQAFDSI